MWKSLLKFFGRAVAEKALGTLTSTTTDDESPSHRRRTREEMKAVYWNKWNKLMAIENRTPAQEEHLRGVIRWLSKYDFERFQSVVYTHPSERDLA